VFKPKEGVDRVEMPKHAVFPVFLGLSSIEDRLKEMVIMAEIGLNRVIYGGIERSPILADHNRIPWIWISAAATTGGFVSQNRPLSPCFGQS
jgi:hypothetical protein